MADMYSRIERLCRENDENITAMCKALGIARGSLTDLKTGRSKSLSTQALTKIADRYGVSVDTLTGTAELPPSAEFALKRRLNDAAKDLTEEELNDVLSYIKFKQSQRS